MWTHLTPPSATLARVLTEAALSPVVVGQAVVALGPCGSLFAFTVAGLVAAVVHGADLVAVTFWPKTGLLVSVLPGGFVPANASGEVLGTSEKPGYMLQEGPEGPRSWEGTVA